MLYFGLIECSISSAGNMLLSLHAYDIREIELAFSLET